VLDVFIGQHENKIDGKARLSIPSQFRKIIESGDTDREAGSLPNFVLIFGDERTDYLEGLTIKQYNKMTRKLRKMDKGDPRRQQMELILYSLAQLMTLDETGRIVMPPKGRAKLALNANDMVEFTGAGDSFRVKKAAGEAERQAERPAAKPDIGYHPDTNPMDYFSGDDEDDED